MATADTYTAEQREFLITNAPKMRYNDLCDLFNRTFDETKTLKQIRKWCAYHGIRGISSRDFTPEQEKFIIENQYDMTREQLAEMFNERFGTSVTGDKLKSWCQYRNLRNANSGRFEDGNVSWQTGLHGEEYWSHFSEETKAKVLRHLVETNQKYKDGDVVMRHGIPAIYKKVSSGNGLDANLTYASTVEWERHFGAIPEDSIVIHIDGDIKNYAIDNLRLIPMAYLPILKHLGGLTDNAQMNRVKLKYCELFTALKSA